MNFTNSPYETMMKEVPPAMKPSQLPKAPKGSKCHGCPYWRGVGCMSCYRDLLKGKSGGR